MANTFVSLRRLQRFYDGLKMLFASKSEIPTTTSELTNDSGFITEHQNISGKVNINQGIENANKYLGINDGGLVEPLDGLVIYDEDDGNVTLSSGVGYTMIASDKVDKYQGVANMNKFLSINANGMVTPSAGMQIVGDNDGNVSIYNSIPLINDQDTTYSISINNNIITLTASDGTTSNVPLPVYDGGVT